MDFPEDLQILAERNFESLWCVYKEEIKSENHKLIILNKLKDRYSTIKHLTMNGILDKKLYKSFIDSQLKFLFDTYSRDPFNKLGKSVIGWQVSPMHTPEAISTFSFEALLRLNGTYPKLIILEKYESLTSHPDLIKLSKFDQVLGFYKKFMKQNKGKILL